MDKKLTTALEELFLFAPPNTLRKSINQVFFFYLIHNKTLPEDFKTIAEDFYLLTDFFDLSSLPKTRKGATHNLYINPLTQLVN